MTDYNEIKKHWDLLGDTQRMYQASWNDKYMMQKEMIEICKHVGGAETICDIGCNNGWCDFWLLEKFNAISVFGIDYSESLIKQANDTLSTSESTYKDRCAFIVGDILDVGSYPQKKFDVVLLKRVLINLTSPVDQIRAIERVASLLKPEGKIILTEAVEENWSNLNKLRVEFGLDALKQAWHNIYLNTDVVKYFYEAFDVSVDDDYSSTYYIVSRVLHPWMKKINSDKSWDYLSEVNKLGAMLPSVGDCGVQRLFVLSPK